MHMEMAKVTEAAPRSANRHELPSLANVPARIRDVAALRGLGYSYREIGRPLNITGQAVSIMLGRYRRSLKSLRKSMELCNLSSRAVNALGRHGVTSREQARSVSILELLENERNCGRKTLEEIARWMNDGHTSRQAPEFHEPLQPAMQRNGGNGRSC